MSSVPGSTTYTIREVLEDLGPGGKLTVSALYKATLARKDGLERNAFDQAIHRMKKAGVIEKDSMSGEVRLA